MNSWYKNWFDSEEYLEVYSHRNENDAVNLLNLINTFLSLPAGSSILDAACGSGRFCNLFAAQGFKITAFDLSKKLLELSVQESLNKHLKVQYFRADLRHIPLKSSFDLILNMFTSFGYFNTDEENFSFIDRTYSLLKINGFFIFDYLNKENVIRNIKPRTEKRINDKIITEERSINNNRVEKVITIKTDKGKKVFKESVHMYTKDEIIKKSESFGFEVYKIFGDYLGTEFDELNSERLIVFFRK
ncbi:MAG: class I SAM-dependent methyltransferase [Bacteroidota bacterium]